MKNFPVTFLMLFAFELWSSEAGPLFSFTGSLNVPSPGANTNGSIFDEILSNFRREISEQDTVLENNIGNINKSLEVVNNAVDRIDHSLSDLVPFLMDMIVETRTLMNKMDKRLSCDKQLVEPMNAQASWNAAEDRVTITCNEGFMTESQAFEQTVECLGGIWSYYEPCKKTCGKPLGEPINAQASWNAAEDLVNITCNEGFMTESQASEQTVECLGDRWSYYEPCKKICPEPFYVEGDLCLHFVLEGHSWIKAKENCAQMGPESTLAMLTTASEARSFKDFLDNKVVSAPTGKKGYVWLGATEDTQDRGNWFWLDESRVVLNDELGWRKGEPNDDQYSYSEDCLDFHFVDLALNDERCHHELSSVCEISALGSGFVKYTSSIHA